MAPRRKAKTRVDHLVEALETTQKVSESLHAIDLKTAPVAVRQAVQSARQLQAGLAEAVKEAVRLDVPPAPRQTRKASRATVRN